MQVGMYARSQKSNVIKCKLLSNVKCHKISNVISLALGDAQERFQAASTHSKQKICNAYFLL